MKTRKSAASQSEMTPDSPIHSAKNSPDKSVSFDLPKRVPKPKIIHDPTLEECKRRMLRRSIEAEKSQKLAEAIINGNDVPPKAPAMVDQKLLTFPIRANHIGSKRRQTISTSTTVSTNRCIVCNRNRSDHKKGRFVTCIHCLSGGNLSCLRSAKYFGTEDDEGIWQCPPCKICKICRKRRDDEQLYKCKSCFMSFHVACTQPNAKKVTKKHFLCGRCEQEEAEPPKSILSKRNRDEFAGLSHGVQSISSQPKPAGFVSSSEAVSTVTFKSKYCGVWQTLDRLSHKLTEDVADDLHFEFRKMVQQKIENKKK